LSPIYQYDQPLLHPAYGFTVANPWRLPSLRVVNRCMVEVDVFKGVSLDPVQVEVGI
jgi:hypothetical protein